MLINKIRNYIFSCISKIKSLIIPVLVAFLIILGGYFLYVYNKPVRTVTVVGVSSKVVQNQIANFYASILERNAVKIEVAEKAKEKSDQLIEKLKEFGIPEADLKTTSVNIYQDQYYDNNSGQTRFGDWNANISIDITVRDISQVDKLTELLTQLDISNFGGPNFTFDNKKIDDSELLSDPLSDGRAKAEILAARIGLSLGEIQRIVEGYDTNNNQVFGDYGRGAGGGGGLVPGTGEATKVLTITYSL